MTPAARAAGTHDCPLCGNRFEGGEATCGRCPMSRGCGGVTCCPRCGYEFVDRSATVEAFRRLGRVLSRLLAPRAAGRGRPS